MSFWTYLFGNEKEVRANEAANRASREAAAAARAKQEEESQARAEEQSKAAQQLVTKFGREFFDQVRDHYPSMHELALKSATFLGRKHIPAWGRGERDLHYYIYRGVPFALHEYNPGSADPHRRDYRWYFLQPKLPKAAELAEYLDDDEASPLDEADPDEDVRDAKRRLLRRKHGAAFVENLERVDFEPYFGINSEHLFGGDYNVNELPGARRAYSGFPLLVGGEAGSLYGVEGDRLMFLRNSVMRDIDAFIELAKHERQMSSAGDGLEFAEGISGMKKQRKRRK